jgi:N-acetylhexosamine 1-kinase
MFEVLKKFGIFDSVDSVDRFGRGIINRTYLASAKNNRYILQMINNEVFKDPEDVIKNINAINDFSLKEPLLEKVIFGPALKAVGDGSQFVKVEDTFWCGYVLPKTTSVFKKVINNTLIHEIGKGVGLFQRSMIGFEPKKLKITISDCHDTFKLYSNLQKAIFEDYEKAVPLFNETKFLDDRQGVMTMLSNLLNTGQVPLRVIHNNFRLSNMLFDSNTYQFKGLIGLDAVMPGTLLTDFGDSIRYFTSTSREDESNLEFVKINMTFFKEFVKGFFEQVKEFITDRETEYLVDSVKIMALENAIRFLTDYLMNNKKYHVDYLEQNLDRAKNQIKLVQDIEANYQEMKAIVGEISSEARKRV